MLTIMVPAPWVFIMPGQPVAISSKGAKNIGRKLLLHENLWRNIYQRAELTIASIVDQNVDPSLLAKNPRQGWPEWRH
jgi:hypothetical protein